MRTLRAVPSAIPIVPIVHPPFGFDQYRRSAFGRVLRGRRERAGLSRALTAELTGLSLTEITSLENSSVLPTLDVIFTLADALRTDAAELLHETRALAEDAVIEEWMERRTSWFMHMDR
jgi:transcriptional regulator with XRE-family HTH domain